MGIVESMVLRKLCTVTGLYSLTKRWWVTSMGYGHTVCHPGDKMCSPTRIPPVSIHKIVDSHVRTVICPKMVYQFQISVFCSLCNLYCCEVVTQQRTMANYAAVTTTVGS